MRNFLEFPKQFEVTKPLTRGVFLRSANLTEVERKTLILYIKDVNILYDITFLDHSEMIVFEIVLNSNARGKYVLSNLVKAVAQSFPYNCMLLVRQEGVVRLFSFDGKENKVDSCRRRVLNIFASREIIPIQDDFSDRIMVRQLRNAIMESMSAKELNEKWNNILGNSGCIFDSFECLLDIYHKAVEKKERLVSIIERESTYDYENDSTDELESDLFDGVTLEGEREYDEEMYALFCAANVRPLYVEASAIAEWTEQDWLKRYIIACNDYSNQIFKKSINSLIAKRIASSFWNGVEEDDYGDIFDIDGLKENIGEYYFDQREE